MRRLAEKFRPMFGLSTQEVFRYEGFDIPVELMELTGGGADTFDEISRAHMDCIEKFIGLKPNHSVLEIGCGIGRDAIPLTKRLSSDGKYLGVDITGPSIDWCKRSISKKFPNFRFEHLDVKSELYNPAGTIKSMQDMRIPLQSGTVNLIILQSVFTHLLRTDILHYMKEFKRLLKSDGRVFATMFIIDDAILASARATNLTPSNLMFEHEVDEGCRINDPLQPTGAVAYTSEALDQMLKEASLRLARPLLKGGWSGYYPDPDYGQEVAILMLA